MNRSDTLLAITRAHAVVPPASRSVREWRDDVDTERAAPGASPYRGLTELLFAEVDRDPYACHGAAQGALRFPWARHHTQADLAQQAAQGLAGVDLKRCRAALYSTSSVDENFFQSTISRLASTLGFSRAPHFAVSQLQAASWIAALDILDAMSRLDAQPFAALYVAAEKWPAPFPRCMADGTVLGDGAAALWIEPAEEAAGLQVVDSLLQSTDPFVEPDGRMYAGGRMVEAAAGAVEALLSRNGLRLSDVAGWIPSGLGARCERALLDSLGLAHLESAAAHEACLGATAGPLSVAGLLEALQAGRVPDGSLHLGWGASWGGAFGAVLLRARVKAEGGPG